MADRLTILPAALVEHILTLIEDPAGVIEGPRGIRSAFVSASCAHREFRAAAVANLRAMLQDATATPATLFARFHVNFFTCRSLPPMELRHWFAHSAGADITKDEVERVKASRGDASPACMQSSRQTAAMLFALLQRPGTWRSYYNYSYGFPGSGPEWTDDESVKICRATSSDGGVDSTSISLRVREQPPLGALEVTSAVLFVSLDEATGQLLVSEDDVDAAYWPAGCMVPDLNHFDFGLLVPWRLHCVDYDFNDDDFVEEEGDAAADVRLTRPGSILLTGVSKDGPVTCSWLLRYHSDGESDEDDEHEGEEVASADESVVDSDEAGSDEEGEEGEVDGEEGEEAEEGEEEEEEEEEQEQPAAS